MMLEVDGLDSTRRAMLDLRVLFAEILRRSVGRLQSMISAHLIVLLRLQSNAKSLIIVRDFKGKVEAWIGCRHTSHLHRKGRFAP
jgi:hypothetical protein